MFLDRCHWLRFDDLKCIIVVFDIVQKLFSLLALVVVGTRYYEPPLFVPIMTATHLELTKLQLRSSRMHPLALASFLRVAPSCGRKPSFSAVESTVEFQQLLPSSG